MDEYDTVKYDVINKYCTHNVILMCQLFNVVIDIKFMFTKFSVPLNWLNELIVE